MSISQKIKQHPKTYAFWTGCLFLFGYWLFGYDGITFSDDVYYLLAGKSFWEGTMEMNAYHFSTRWGAYVPAGFLGFLFGMNPQLISLISWLSYMATFGILLKILPKNANPWILLIWFGTQVYFLHFLTKVYPDSQLVFWVTLIPFTAYFRNENPIWAALGLISGLFFGFITKETIVFLAPFPLLLLVWDWKNQRRILPFYFWMLGIGLLFGGFYLGYFWWEFGNPLYRFESIQDGHYISEYTYADKSGWVMLKRLTILPIQTFVERAFWPWLVLAIPGVWISWKSQEKKGLEFSLALVCLMLGFWFMSTNFRFYNPLYLNPRHLIILVPILAYLIALGWKEIWNSPRFKQFVLGGMALGILVSMIQQDWKMVLFQVALLAILFWNNAKLREISLALLLLFPVLKSITYQQELKAYPDFLNSLQEVIQEDSSPILVNNFVHFSREVLLPENTIGQGLLLPIEKLDSLKTLLPSEFRVFLYDYYLHAYPKEQEDVDRLEVWLEQNAEMTQEEKSGKNWVRSFTKK